MSDFGAPFDPSAEDLPLPGDGLDLRTFLLQSGVAADEVERADADGTLELLAIEHLVAGERPRYDLDEVAALSGVTREQVRLFWKALGFPDPAPGQKLFGDLDLEVLTSVVRFIVDGALEPEIALQMARVLGSSVGRIASAQVDAIETRAATTGASVDQVGEVPDATGEERAGELVGAWARIADPDEQLAVRRGAELLPMMPKVMEFVWRRHMTAAARQRRLNASAGEGDRVCVGFADLVGFTAQTQQLDEEALAEVVSRFESIAYEVVADHGGRVVKMIGDEVMFLHDTVAGGAELALALAETYRNDGNLSDVRVGLAAGPVLRREGDVYGPVVNLASRIVSIAYPGAVVVAEDIHDALAEDEAFTFRGIRQHYLKDIGRVRLWTMRRAGDEDDVAYRRARDRRAARREFLLRRRAEHRVRSTDLPDDVGEEVAHLLEDDTITGDEATAEFEAITVAVLDADLDEDLQVELLADIETARRLAELEDEAQRRALEADLEAEGRLEAIEEEARRKVERIELDARRRIEEALQEAEDKAFKANEEATRKVKRVAEETERKADQAEKEARRVARRKAAKRKAEKQARQKARPAPPAAEGDPGADGAGS